MTSITRLTGLGFILLWISQFSTLAAHITLHIANPTVEEAYLFLPDGREYTIPLDSTGYGEINISHDEPVYANLVYQYVGRTLYLHPDTELDLSFDANIQRGEVRFSGNLVEINSYLNSGKLEYLTVNDTEGSLEDFLKRGSELMDHNLEVLKKSGLPREFKDMERHRLLYAVNKELPTYPFYHARMAKDYDYTPSSLYWSALDSLFVVNPDLLKYAEYRSYMDEALKQLARKEYPEVSSIDRVVKYVDTHIHDPKVAEHLIHTSLFNYLERKGDEEWTTYEPVYRRFVKEKHLLDDFNRLGSKWTKISKGAPSPDFRGTDLQGREYSLEDFKGKYVYIDVWATWCGPCRKEIPHLQRLEETLEGEDIYFVSLSCDTKRDAWEDRVKKGMKGIQILLNPDDTFMQEYMISGIPRFILLDREGHILSHNMSRPSDPKTEVALKALLDPTKPSK